MWVAAIGFLWLIKNNFGNFFACWVIVGFWVDVSWVMGVGFCCECEVCSVSLFHGGSIITGGGMGWQGLWNIKQWGSCIIACVFHGWGCFFRVFSVFRDSDCFLSESRNAWKTLKGFG